MYDFGTQAISSSARYAQNTSVPGRGPHQIREVDMYDSFVSGWGDTANVGTSKGFWVQYHFDIVSVRLLVVANSRFIVVVG